MLKKIFFSILTVVFLAVLTLALGEILVRVFLGREVPLFPRFVVSAPYGEFTIRANTPGMTYRHRSADGDWQVRINNQGFRADKEFAVEKPAGIKRILLLGDSFTMASEVNIEDSFGTLLEKKLGEKGIRTEVINTGVSGYSNAEELVVLENKGLQFKPDIVVLSFFINDYADNLRSGLYRLNKEAKPVVYHREYSPGGKVQTFFRQFPVYDWVAQNSYLYNYLNRVLSLAAKDRLEKQHMEQIKQELQTDKIEAYQHELAVALVKRIAEVSHAHGAGFVLLDIPTFWDERSVRFKERVLNDTDLYVDSLDLFQKIPDRNLIYRPHGDRHWTELGHKLVAEYLAEKLEPMLRQERR